MSPGPQVTWRHLELTPARLRRWWGTFHADHPGVTADVEEGEVVLTSTNGSIARFAGWYPVTDIAGDDDALAQLAATPHEVGIILVRRGGYSLGRATGTDRPGGGTLLAHKTGSRYVQSRTAAGGWSQQRFARRRENQASELVRAATDHAVRVLAQLLDGGASAAGLAVGGDGLLIDAVLADPRLEIVRGLPRREFTNLPDPRYKVLEDVAGRIGTVRLAVHNP